jgi:O-antigen ligase/polysaccharide polymerase Wzy-like membrane protein/tetratricopeptide repeat protein
MGAPLGQRERAALALLAIGTVAFMPGALNRFVFLKVAVMAGGVALSFTVPARNRLSPRIVMILGLGSVILLVATLGEAAPLTALVGRSPRFEGVFVLPVYVGAALAGARLLGPDRAEGSTAWFMKWLALAAVVVSLEAALEFAGLRPLASSVSRPGSLLGNASDEGAWAVLVLGPLAAIAVTTRKWPYVAGAVATMVILVASGSRGALLGAIAVALVLVILEPRRSIKVTIITGLVVVAACSFVAPATRARIVGTSPYSVETVTGRVLLWEETARLVEHHLFLGVGSSGFVNTIPQYHDREWELKVGTANPPDSPHDWILQAASDGGVLLALDALALAVIVLLEGLAATRRQVTRGERAAVVGMLAGVSGYGVALLFHFTSPGTTPLAAAFAGALVAVPLRTPSGVHGHATPPPSQLVPDFDTVKQITDVLRVAFFGGLALLLFLASWAEIPLRTAIDDAAAGRLEAANRSFHLAENLRPWDPSIAATAGHAFAVLTSMGEPGAAHRAAPWVATEVRENPRGVVPLEDAASLDVATHHLLSAVVVLRRCQHLDPTNPDILLSLGRAYLREGSLSQALPVLERAARYAPHSAAVHRALLDARR